MGGTDQYSLVRARIPWLVLPPDAYTALRDVHILLCSGALGLAKFMRRLLTGYAVSYNLRHRRHGPVFQNRYKSIVCDGERYFTELVRYIHLNPLRVERVKDLKQLEKYPYRVRKGSNLELASYAIKNRMKFSIS
ncbi:MAG: hypothetical protein WD688_15125 [Candidatus Binatia bacterium]